MIEPLEPKRVESKEDPVTRLACGLRPIGKRATIERPLPAPPLESKFSGKRTTRSCCRFPFAIRKGKFRTNEEEEWLVRPINPTVKLNAPRKF